MKNKTGKAKRLKVLNELGRLRDENEALAKYLQAQTAKLEALNKVLAEQAVKAQAADEADAAMGVEP